MIKKLLLIFLVIIVAIQFIHPAKNTSTDVNPRDITRMYPVPDSVSNILKKACNDCHSDNTSYPWYNNVQPVAWWLRNHINEGKRHLNFSEFGSYTKQQQAKKLRGAAREVREGTMPLNSYLWIHKDAVLTENEKKILINWANGLAQLASPATAADSAKYKL